MQGSLHLALAFVVGAVGFSTGAATAGAWLLVIGSGLQAVGATANWILEVGDQFAERSIGFYLNSASTFVALPGLAIVAHGIVSRV